MESIILCSQSSIDTLNSAKGSIIGALLGDASGTYLEFSSKLITLESINKSMSLPGGGPHNVAPG
jgi:hypothetical protein